jgi:hypothetical protein
VSRAATQVDRLHHARIWNIFRTLELLTPSFWIRRLHVRLTGEGSPTSPQIVSVHLWRPLPRPPIQRIDGEVGEVVPDVLIETEHAVWTLMAESAVQDWTDLDRVAGVVDAGLWFAGARQHHCGIITDAGTNTSAGAVWQRRYGRSRDSARLRSATRGPAIPDGVRLGTIQWAGLSALLQDCRDASSLPSIERALARNVLDWLSRVG